MFLWLFFFILHATTSIFAHAPIKLWVFYLDVIIFYRCTWEHVNNVKMFTVCATYWNVRHAGLHACSHVNNEHVGNLQMVTEPDRRAERNGWRASTYRPTRATLQCWSRCGAVSLFNTYPAICRNLSTAVRVSFHLYWFHRARAVSSWRERERETKTVTFLPFWGHPNSSTVTVAERDRCEGGCHWDKLHHEVGQLSWVCS